MKLPSSACAEVDIAAAPEQILEFVMDLRRYREADHKVGRVFWLRRDGNEATALASARLAAGINTPPGLVSISLTPYTRLDVRSRPVGLFNADFLCTPLNKRVTRVRHREALAVPGLSNWLRRSVEDELQRMKERLEAS